MLRTIKVWGTLTLLLSANIGWSAANLNGPLEICGTLSAATANSITVNGVVIPIPAGTPIGSPTVDGLTATQLSALPKLPGRAQNGFLEGNACVVGQSFTTLPGGAHTLSTIVDVLVDPGSENMIVGDLSAGNSCSTRNCDAGIDVLKILGVSLKRLADTRISSVSWGVTNRGFPARLNGNTTVAPIQPVTQAIIGSPANAEGYYGQAGTGLPSPREFYWHHLDILAAPLVNPNLQEVSVDTFRAVEQAGQCQSYRGKGFVHTPNFGPVLVRNNVTLANIFPAATTAASVTPVFGRWVNKTDSVPVGPCVREVRVTFGTSSIVRPVDVKVIPPGVDIEDFLAPVL